MTVPRIPALRDEDMDEEQRDAVAPLRQGGRIDNVGRTVVNHPALLAHWLPFVRHVMFQTTLPARDREILILRTGWLCRAEYEWAQHVNIGKKAGLTDEDIARIVAGPGAPGISQKDNLLLRVADELHRTARLGDETWSELAAHYERKQVMDIVFTVGQYTLVSMMLNSFGVEVDDYLKNNYPALPR
jgi:4-carboxymuconolactone decarboxylase